MSRMRRGVRLAVVTVALAVTLGATAANAEAYEWIVEGKPLPEGVKKELTCNAAGPFSVKGKVLAQEVQIEYAETNCLGWVIWNSAGEAYSLGRLVLNGAAVVKPLGCKTALGITTNLLTGRALKFPKLPSELGLTYRPLEGETLATIKLEGCAAAGLYKLTGMTVAEVEPLNVLKEVQPYEFSKEIEELVGERLKLGGEVASFDGLLEFKF